MEIDGHNKKILLTSDLHYGYTEDTHGLLGTFYKGLQRHAPIDYIIIAGDIISHEQSQWRPALEQIRSYFDCPILVVLGNHDLWQYVRRPEMRETLWNIKKNIFNTFRKYDITYLPMSPVIDDSLRIYGFDGWYGNTEPPSNDLNYMPHMTEGYNTHDYLRKTIGIDQLEMIPDKSEVQQIVVTHFDYNGHPMSADNRWLDVINKKADILCVGHSHQYRVDNVMGMKIINSGSDYNVPKSLCYEGVTVR